MPRQNSDEFYNQEADRAGALWSAKGNGKIMIHCKELCDKVVRLVTIYEDGTYGPEVHIEFTDGTTFSACLKNNVSIEAKYIRDEGGEPSILRDYTTPAVSR